MVLRLAHPGDIISVNSQWEEELDSVVDDLDATEDGESSEEAHCATNKTKGWLHRHLIKQIIFDGCSTEGYMLDRLDGIEIFWQGYALSTFSANNDLHIAASVIR